MAVTTSAPAIQPWDHDVIVNGALAVLRLMGDDVDAVRIETAEKMATDLLDAELDAVEPMAVLPDALSGAAVNLTLELYRRKDAPFGVLNAWSVDEIAVRISNDMLRGVRGLVRPYKTRWGVG
jgi:hypothetical protein